MISIAPDTTWADREWKEKGQIILPFIGRIKEPLGLAQLYFFRDQFDNAL